MTIKAGLIVTGDWSQSKHFVYLYLASEPSSELVDASLFLPLITPCCCILLSTFKVHFKPVNTTVPNCCHYCSAVCIKFSADDILKCFSYFSQKTGFDISCKLSPLETICMNCQILFSGKTRKNIISLVSAELAKRVVKAIHSSR